MDALTFVGAQSEVPQKDVIIAMVGAAAALSGLVLVFLGVLVTSYQGLIGNSSQHILARFKNAGWLALTVFLGGVASLVIATAWLIASGGHCFYVAVLVVFFLDVGALTLLAIYSTWRVLLRG